jgi:hypothetical protein
MTRPDGGDQQGPTIFDNDRIRFYVRKLQRHPVYQVARSQVRIVRQLLPNLWRSGTQRYRQMPSAVIVGAGKAGTTQLYSYLIRHPRCFGGRTKEIHYFSKFSDRPLRWYRSQFPIARQLAKVRGLCIEASPSYLQSPEALQRMRDVLPEAKVIALLRDPVARAFSNYQHEKLRHREARTFLEVVRETIAADSAGPDYRRPLWPNGGSAGNYISRGYYAMHIEALWRIYPREQVLIVDSAELFADTNAICQRVFAFMGVEQFDMQPGKIYNRGFYREVLDQEAADLLREHYRPHDQRLTELLGRPLSWIKASTASPTTSAAALASRTAAA